MIKDYDLEIIYHPGKANVVADTLSRKSRQEVTVARLTGEEWLRAELIRRGFEVSLQREDVELKFMEVRSELMSEILIAQSSCEWITGLRRHMAEGRGTDFSKRANGMLTFKGMIVVPQDPDLRRRLLTEAHSTPYTIHPGSQKMCQDLSPTFWWKPMKKDVVDFIAACQTCQ